LKLNHEKKRFVDCIKVFVCNLKTEMCRLLLKHYDWQKEVVPALAMIVERTGYVKLEGGRLEVTLRGFADREIDYAARHLCEDLNHMQPVTLELQLKSRNVPPALESENGPAENPQEIILDSPSCKRLFLWDL